MFKVMEKIYQKLFLSTNLQEETERNNIFTLPYIVLNISIILNNFRDNRNCKSKSILNRNYGLPYLSSGSADMYSVSARNIQS